MLSTLNAYQRSRKQTDIKIKKLFEAEHFQVSLFIDSIIVNNVLFSQALPFKLIFSLSYNTSLGALLSSRRIFDDELIRVAVKSGNKIALKNMINHFSQRENMISEPLIDDL